MCDIEVYDLDVLDPVSPVATLHVDSKVRGRIWKALEQSAACASASEGSHVDDVTVGERTDSERHGKRRRR